MTLVVDASVVVAALVDGGPDGDWAEGQLRGTDLAAPSLLHVEVADILRRAVRARRVPAELASLAHHDLLGLRVTTYPYELVGERVWALRRNLTAYDAWYVAVAERLGAPLVTLDRRLARATGPTCAFRTPPAGRSRPGHG